MNIREIALKMLLDYEENEKYINLSLNSHISDKLTGEERGALTSLLYTTVEHKLTYDYLIGALTGRSIDKISLHTKNILRLGLCQLLHMNKIPDFAAVNESVKLGLNKGERAIVNATLRSAVNCKDNLPYPKKEKNAARYYSVIYSLPIATVRHFIAELGEQESVKLFETLSDERRTTLTANTIKCTPEQLVENLKSEGYDATRATISPISVYVHGSFDPRRCAAFSNGEFIVQDEASVLPALILSAKPGERVIDVCSAPGGKSASVAILSSDKAEIYALDIHESKLSLIESTINRLGIKSVTASVQDAATPRTDMLYSADKVLCDVPCSGLGVISKKPDLRYKDINELTRTLPPIQLEILNESSKYLKPSGTLVYSTCTVNKAENEEVVNRFLASNPDFYTEDFSYGEYTSSCGMMTLLPHVHGTDGFFVAKLRKKDDTKQ